MCIFAILFLFLYIAVLSVYKYLRIFKEASTNFWKYFYFYFYFYEYFCFYKLQISVIILTGPLSIWFVSMISIFILKLNHALHDCNRIWAHNRLVFKRKLSHLEKAAKTLLVLVFLYYLPAPSMLKKFLGLLYHAFSLWVSHKYEFAVEESAWEQMLRMATNVAEGKKTFK